MKNGQKSLLLKRIGLNLIKFRRIKNISLKELAEQTKIRKSYLQKIEKGTAVGMKLSHLVKLIKILKITAHELLD